jgi:hypothetical protein
MEEFEKLLSESFQSDLPTEPSIPKAPAEVPESFETAEASQSE